jgi:regulator of RNase E activity RraB
VGSIPAGLYHKHHKNMKNEITAEIAIEKISILLKKGYDVKEAFEMTLGKGSREIFWQEVLTKKGLI